MSEATILVKRRFESTSDDYGRDGNDDWRCEECQFVATAKLNPVTCAECGGDMLRAPQIRTISR